MHRERLKIQAEILRSVSPDVRFDMGTWADRDECGTAACALGYAALDGRLRHEGLAIQVTPDDGSILKVTSLAEFNRVVDEDTWSIDVTYQGKEGMPAAAAFYEIDLSTAYYLFTPGAYPQDVVQAQDVAERIERLLLVGDTDRDGKWDPVVSRLSGEPGGFV